MGRDETVAVYSPDRSEVWARVSKQTTSIGAAKAAGSLGAYRAMVEGDWVWVAKMTYGRVV